MAKSVEDRIVAATVHGLIAAANKYVGGPHTPEAAAFADRAIELTKEYLAGEEIDEITMNDYWTQGTVDMLNETFTLYTEN
jgi:hypothetical protein